MPTRPCIERSSMAAVRSTFTKPFGLTRLISFPKSLSDIDLSTAANDPRTSASFSARKNPQRISANTPPVFPGLRPRIWPHLLRLVTKAMSDRLLASRQHHLCNLHGRTGNAPAKHEIAPDHFNPRKHISQVARNRNLFHGIGQLAPFDPKSGGP